MKINDICRCKLCYDIDPDNGSSDTCLVKILKGGKYCNVEILKSEIYPKTGTCSRVESFWLNKVSDIERALYEKTI